MQHEHLDLFLDAMHRGDASSLAPHVAESIVIWSPLVAEPFRGKSQVLAVLGYLLKLRRHSTSTTLCTETPISPSRSG
ncbi:nuclear transport factor 2 family protein [Paraburkholderia tropica]|uniref:nuclear transport factor 2 family protein n=1 Tax=Paraburkholderia tropica TaxID=92647 RepID=UPI0015FFA80F|nr:nuclear transport factor 2 family protein [Paraburkholderia tropica]QNB16159.1 nuclear transport factor 2 family protein [Paraburkholderia tropica]